MISTRRWFAVACVFILAACQNGSADQIESASPSPSPDAVPALPATYTPKPPGKLIYVDRLEGWDSVSQEIRTVLTSVAADRGWSFLAYSDLPDLDDLNGAVLVVISGGTMEFSELFQALEETLFILVAVEGATPQGRVAVIGPEGMRADMGAFIAGYISAMVTEDWRVGSIGVGESGEGRAAIEGFLNGAVFFCGLCRPAFPPFHSYPSSAAVSVADAAGIQAGFEQLSSQAIKTIYVTHEFSVESVSEGLEGLPDGGILWIGPTPPEHFGDVYWLATVKPDPASTIDGVVQALSSGADDLVVGIPYVIEDINEDVLTVGKMQVLADLLRDLDAGVIDTAIDPLTGRER